MINRQKTQAKYGKKVFQKIFMKDLQTGALMSFMNYLKKFQT